MNLSGGVEEGNVWLQVYHTTLRSEEGIFRELSVRPHASGGRRQQEGGRQAGRQAGREAGGWWGIVGARLGVAGRMKEEIVESRYHFNHVLSCHGRDVHMPRPPTYIA